MIRQPIVAVLGHVDHGKTSLLDMIRGTAVASKEAGAITQHVGASEIDVDTIKKVCGSVLLKTKIDIKIPGLLFIDTPGHEAFTSLRDRGGSIADIALLIIDITQGIQPQTIESINILKTHKTPFIVVANKVDRFQGWKSKKTYSISESLSQQQISDDLDMKLYEIVGELSEHGFDSERFDRVMDFTKQIMIIPASAKTGEGMAEILLYLSGISQKFLEQNLNIEVKGPGKGSILEVKEEKGLGTTVDLIIYDGKLSKADEIVFGTLDGPKKTKVRAMMKPRLPGEKGEGKFKYVDDIYAAAGAKIFAPELDGAVSGSPVMVISNNEKEAFKIIADQMKEILFESEQCGVVIKTDTLGSAEALMKMMNEKNIPARSINIGDVHKKDILDAQVVKESNKYLGIILGFNVKINTEVLETAEKMEIPVITSNVIYDLIDKYVEWKDKEKRKDMDEMIKSVPWPCSMKILPGHMFRDCKPCIIGVEILVGKIRSGTKLMSERGEIIGEIKNIQLNKDSVSEAVKGMKVAISIDKAVYCRQLAENMKIYPFINKQMSDVLIKKFEDELETDEKELLEEIVGKSRNLI
ncbi:translation initiation factor IF-2 [Candidatus Micrarchaeota archaeon]|nr:translation initiation factor IF-2 [Candidatus Micrarchaeota archaeon]